MKYLKTRQHGDEHLETAAARLGKLIIVGNYEVLKIYNEIKSLSQVELTKLVETSVSLEGIDVTSFYAEYHKKVNGHGSHVKCADFGSFLAGEDHNNNKNCLK